MPPAGHCASLVLLCVGGLVIATLFLLNTKRVRQDLEKETRAHKKGTHINTGANIGFLSVLFTLSYICQQTNKRAIDRFIMDFFTYYCS
jgi:hypothetical protein